MLKTSRDRIMPTAIAGSYSPVLRFDASLQGRSIKAALGDSPFHQQYQDAIAAVTERAEGCRAPYPKDGEWPLDPRRLWMLGAASAIELF